MTERKLNEIEIKVTGKNIIIHEERTEYLNYLLRYYDIMLMEGLKQNYLNQRREFEMKRREVLMEKQEIYIIISEARKLLRRGYIKEEKK